MNYITSRTVAHTFHQDFHFTDECILSQFCLYFYFCLMLYVHPQFQGYRKSRPIPLLFLWALMSCYGVNFTFYHSWYIF